MPSTTRFNLRSRKSLLGQIQCSSCKRHYFAADDADDQDQSGNICCDCEKTEIKQIVGKTTPRGIQQMETTIKTEKIDPSYGEIAYSPKSSKIGSKLLNSGGMVQIHCNQLVQPIANKLAKTRSSTRISIKQEVINNGLIKVDGTNDDAYIAESQTNGKITQMDIITKNDTADSLRQKFPKANAFELEFMLFITGNK